MKKFQYAMPKEMSKPELKKWIVWAAEEIKEYQKLIKTLETELKKR